MKTYKLNVYCRRNGISQDAGTHAQIEATSDEVAISELKSKLPWLLRFYDEVYWAIIEVESDRKVASYGM